MGLLIALLLTILIECGIVAIQSRDFQWVCYVAVINVVTNPTVNLIVLAARNYISGTPLEILKYVLEVLVVLSEGFMVYKLRATGSFKGKVLSFPRSLLYAFILNLASYSLGLLIFRIM